MAYTIATRSNQDKTAARQYLTAEQTMALVMQIKQRNEFLKINKGTLTLEEKLLCIRGERAFNELLDEYQGYIWSIIHRYNFADRITTDEMYQYAVIAFNRAISTHNPDKPVIQKTFSGWVYLHIKSKFSDLYRAELRRSKRVEAASGSLKIYFQSDNNTPLDSAIEENLKEIIDQETEAALPQRKTQVLRSFYLQGLSRTDIARSVKCSPKTVDYLRRDSLKELSTRPKLRELAEAYFS